MTLSNSVDAQGGLESVGKAERVASLTGIRAVAALLVMLTHAAYTTGKYTHGYAGLVYSRAEIGVPIFFVLSGFLLFGPWVKAAASGGAPPSVRRYAWHRVRRIMPAYVVTVLAAYLLYHFRTAGPNPGHTWEGLFRNLTLTQIYTDNYLYSFLHQGLTQMWSLAVEVAFYVVLPLLAYLLLVVLCRRRWRPATVVGGPRRAGADHPGVADPRAHHRLPARRGAAVAADVPPMVHRRNGPRGPAAAGRAGVRARVHSARGGLLLHRVHADRRRAHHVTGRAARGAGEGGLLCGDRHADGGTAGARGPRSLREVSGVRGPWCSSARSPTRSS